MVRHSQSDVSYPKQIFDFDRLYKARVIMVIVTIIIEPPAIFERCQHTARTHTHTHTHTHTTYPTFRPSDGRRRGLPVHQTASQSPAPARAGRCRPRTGARCRSGRRAPTARGLPRSTMGRRPVAAPASSLGHLHFRVRNRAPQRRATGLFARRKWNWFLQQTTANFGRSMRAPRATSQPSP